MDTLNRGPYVAAGSLMDGRDEDFDGPSLSYQGHGFPDPRVTPISKDAASPSVTPFFFQNGKVCMVDGIPSASATATIAASQSPSTTAGVALTLVTSVAGTAANVQVFTPGVPFIPQGTSVATTAFAIDFGFCTGTTAVNSSTVVVTDNSQFTQGQWIVIGGATAVTNRALVTQVASVSGVNLTTIFISPVAGSTINNAPIGGANLYVTSLPSSPTFGPAAASANSVDPFINAGFGKMFDARQGLTRNIVVAAASIGSGTTALIVNGWDIYGFAMSELITANGTTLVAGKKAFKYIKNVLVSAGATSVTPATIQVGVGDIMGFHLVNDRWEYMSMYWGGQPVIATTGWTGAFLGTASSTTSGDVRGTQNMSTAITGTGVALGAIDGTRRAVFFNSPPGADMVGATPTNATILMGVAQA